MNSAVTNAQSFVLFPLGSQRFALPAGDVLELSRPGSLQEFPHTTPGLAGVLVSRGRILPVWDIAQVLLGAHAPICKFYLLAWRNFGPARECTAIPVSGGCQLFHGESLAPAGEQPAYVRGALRAHEDLVTVIDLEKLAAVQREVLPQPSAVAAGEEVS